MFVHPAEAGVNTLWDVTRARLRTAIRAAMRDAQIPTVTELVKRAQITRNTLYNWEGGITAPALDELDRVAAALGVPVSVLVDAWAGRTHQETAPPDVWAERLLAGIMALEDKGGVTSEELADAEAKAAAHLVVARQRRPPPAGGGGGSASNA